MKKCSTANFSTSFNKMQINYTLTNKKLVCLNLKTNFPAELPY